MAPTKEEVTKRKIYEEFPWGLLFSKRKYLKLKNLEEESISN
jgi:hypothetical protein